MTRVAGSEDIATISDVLTASWKSAYRGVVANDYLDLLKCDHWVASLNEGFDDGSLFALVLESNRRVVGAAIVAQGQLEGTANLTSLYLLPDEVGRGLGHIFYSEIEVELMRRGFARCVLDVLDKNARAIRFYEAHGFIMKDETIEVKLGDYEYFCRVYEKRLI